MGMWSYTVWPLSIRGVWRGFVVILIVRLRYCHVVLYTKASAQAKEKSMKHVTVLALYLFAFVTGLGWEQIHPTRALYEAPSADRTAPTARAAGIVYPQPGGAATSWAVERSDT